MPRAPLGERGWSGERVGFGERAGLVKRACLVERPRLAKQPELGDRAARTSTATVSRAGLDMMALAQANAHLGDLVDAVVAGFAEVAAAQARAAERVEELRRWSLVTADIAARGQGKDQADGVDLRDAERSLTAELGCALRLPERSASTLLSESQALVDDHPATMSALRTGAVSYRHAQIVLEATVGLDEPSVLELDALLAHKAQTLTVSRLKTLARRERERRDSRPLVERHQAAAVERRVELHPCQDGMAWLSQYLPAVQATAIFHRLTDIAVAVQGPDEPRTLAQLRADASVDLLLDDDARTALTAAPCEAEGTTTGETPTATASSGRSTGTGAGAGSIDRRAAGPAALAGIAAPHTTDGPAQSIAGIADRVSLGGIKPQVAVTIPVMTLLGHSDEPADLAGHGPIDAHTARRLAAQAPSFLRILTHPETGTVLSVGRDRYAVPADLKTWLRIRDETCRFPGCSRRAQRCDIDHVTDWAHGGTTDHHNLIHLCRHHHRLKHTTTWTVSTEPVHRPPTQPPDRGSSGRDPDHADQNDHDQKTHAPVTHDHLVPTADVVRWTAPSGRSYLDLAAQEVARHPAVGSKGRQTTPDERGEHQFPDDPPF